MGECVENANLWDNHRKDWMPEKVASQLAHPDLVVVRPATTEMQFCKFLDYIVSESSSYSAYLEYSSIPGYLPQLGKDISELPFIAGLLKRRHLNIWLINGNTLGKLNFDPYLTIISVRLVSSLLFSSLLNPDSVANHYRGNCGLL